MAISEERREYNRAWNEANRERVRAYREANRDRRNAIRRENYARDAEARKRAVADAKRWREQNPEADFAQRLRRYGITPDDYRSILESQGGGCAICGRAESVDVSARSKSGRRRLHVDHCHDAGHVRGILCSSCNLGLGKFGDDPARLEAAVRYLRSDRLDA